MEFPRLEFLLAQQGNRRNLRFVTRFVVFTVSLVVLYSLLFHYIMLLEGRDYTTITGLYWTLTVMSTLGFGDITFYSDLGKLFTILVLLSGVVLFLLVLPFTFIRFVYTPWLEAKANALTPREAPRSLGNHVIVVGTDDMTLSIVDRLSRYAFPYVLLLDDPERAAELYEARYKVVLGALDEVRSYERCRVGRASMVLALHDDLKNTNIAATVREAAPAVELAASCSYDESLDILSLAGCDYVLQFTKALGESLASRVFSASAGVNVVGSFEGLRIAECPAESCGLTGKTLKDSDIRERFGLNVAAILKDNAYLPAGPEDRIDRSDILLLAGTEDRLKRFEAEKPADAQAPAPVIILGGGRVGQAVAGALKSRKVPYRVVEQKASLIPREDTELYIKGNAAELETLLKAGINETRTVVVTTHNDDLNIYLTIYCRKLRPDIQIISRATHDRNVDALRHAGSSLVMSQATLAANTVTNLLKPGRVFMLTEGFNIFRVTAPRSLAGKTLLESGIRGKTDCNVIAIRRNGKLYAPPGPEFVIQAGDELILIGSLDAEKAFIKIYVKKN